MKGEKIATRQAYGNALLRLGKENKDVVALDADLSGSTKSKGFSQECPNRFFNMGIAEQDLVATAAGFAASGKIPFASTFAVFSTGRAFDQIRNSVCYPNLNVRIVGSHSGLMTGEDGASHQAIEDIALMRTIPNMAVIVPCDAVEMESAMDYLVKDHKGPAYIRLSRSGVPVVNEDDYEFTLGKGTVLKKGNDVSIIATGALVHIALDSAEMLKEDGIDARVVNIPTLKPIDKDLLIKCAEETGAVITCEDHNIIGGLGSAVAEVLSENCPTVLKRIGVSDVFGESGKPAELYEKYGLTADNIAQKTKELIKSKRE